MTLQEKIAYRDAMEEMAKDYQVMFNHYQDEVNRMNKLIFDETQKRLLEISNGKYKALED